METLIAKTKSTVSTAVLFAFGVVMAGLGLATIGMLAVFALVALGVGMLAAPLVAMTQPSPDGPETAG